MNNTFKIKYKDKIINIKKRLNLLDSLNFVQAVVYALVDEENAVVNYAWKDYEIRKHTILYYTDFVLPDYDGDNVNKYEEVLNQIDSILFNSEIYSLMVGNNEFNASHYNDLLLAIDKQLEFEKAKIINNIQTQSGNMLIKINGEAEKLEGLIDLIQTMFSGVDMQRINTMLPEFMQKVDPSNPALLDAIIKLQNNKSKRGRKKNDKKDGSVISLEKGQISVEDIVSNSKDGE